MGGAGGMRNVETYTRGRGGAGMGFLLLQAMTSQGEQERVREGLNWGKISLGVRFCC